MTEAGEIVRVRGRAEAMPGRRIVVGEGTLKVGYGDPIRRREQRSFVLVDAEGRRFTVDPKALCQVQDRQAQRQAVYHLRKPQAQAATRVR